MLLEPVLHNNTKHLNYGNLHGLSQALMLHNLCLHAREPILVITENTNLAIQLEYDLKFFNHKNLYPVLPFPDWETLPYDNFSPHQDIISNRLKTLYQISNLHSGIIIAPIQSLMHYFCPPEYLIAGSLIIKAGDKLDRSTLRANLTRAGYIEVDNVYEHGEFAIRGSIIDLYPTGINTPFRLDLFDDEIETIKIFDSQTQKSTQSVTSINLMPAKEYPLNDNGIKTFRENFRNIFEGSHIKSKIYKQISKGLSFAGVEYYLPLFFNNVATINDYLPKNAIIAKMGNISAKAESFYKDAKARHDLCKYDCERPILSPEKIFLLPNQIGEICNNFKTIDITANSLSKNNVTNINFNTKPLPNFENNFKTKDMLDAAKAYINKHAQYKILFVAETKGRRELLLNLLNKIQITPKSIESFEDFLATQDRFYLSIGSLEDGLKLDEEKILIIPESILLGQKVMQRRRRKKKQFLDQDSYVLNLEELNINDFVVHIDHGVGKYLGLTTLTVGEIPTEFVTIGYAKNDKLYVPVASLHLISRYSSGEFENIKLNKLGTDTWEKAKKKALSKIHDVAADLLAIYAKREAKIGHKYTVDSEYEKFAATFPFEETYDQEQAINAIIHDMQSEKPMDRLICGDVGFGKTEVALRAAFIAANAGKQVAMLVPTTLLSSQHYQTFCDRFADLPIKIALLSRFVSAKEQQATIDGLKSGKIDIVIGTHKIISKEVKFKNLGLVIIDEEHRFGVKQKEHLKALRANVDILTLSATPIPRTLNFAFSKLRELSIIATPPKRRLAVKTFIRERNQAIIKEALTRELNRGGQIYYLHNDIKTIERVKHELQEIVPEAKINVAHGQMSERDLEKIMLDFYHARFNILICTTIIESGIDIPTANTIIIDRADKLGLAQLHQIRGRVGRSHHQAYAFMFTPNPKTMTKDAKLRLDAIAAAGDLGAGFNIASYDLEIRGAGEILGEEQNGHIQTIGFSLYMEMLEKTVKALEQGEIVSDDELSKSSGAEIDFKEPALIPDTFIKDVSNRLTLYKRIANAKFKEDLHEIQVEIIDRFGLLPPATLNLFSITELKLYLNAFGVKKIDVGNEGGKIEFTQKPNLDFAAMIELIKSNPSNYKIDSNNVLRFKAEFVSFKEKLDFIYKLFAKLKLNVEAA